MDLERDKTDAKTNAARAALDAALESGDVEAIRVANDNLMDCYV